MPTQSKQSRGRSKRGKKRPRPPATDDYIKVVPLRIEDDIARPVQISKGRRAKNCKISPDNLTFSSVAGYRSVQSNRGAFCGTWFFEIHLAHLGATGHARLGVGTVKQEIDAPCGYTQASYAYRDVDGSKVTEGLRSAYADPYKEGDTIGVYLHLPEGGNPNEPKTEIVRWKGKLFQTDAAPSQPAKPLPGSILGYSVNGKWQGPAFTDILEGTYYAAASLFTKPRPDKAASARFNFGPDFKFGPPVVEGLPPARPFCEVPPKPPPVPDEDGTVTVDKTVVAVVKAPPDDDPAPAEPPLATADVKAEPSKAADQKRGAQAKAPVQERGQAEEQMRAQQVDARLMEDLAGPTGELDTYPGSQFGLGNGLGEAAGGSVPGALMHGAAAGGLGGPGPAGSVGHAASGMAGEGPAGAGYGLGTISEAHGRGGRPRSVAAVPRRASGQFPHDFRAPG